MKKLRIYLGSRHHSVWSRIDYFFGLKKTEIFSIPAKIIGLDEDGDPIREIRIFYAYYPGIIRVKRRK